MATLFDQNKKARDNVKSIMEGGGEVKGSFMTSCLAIFVEFKS